MNYTFDFKGRTELKDGPHEVRGLRSEYQCHRPVAEGIVVLKASLRKENTGSFFLYCSLRRYYFSSSVSIVTHIRTEESRNRGSIELYKF
jgi:hypothetical protein